jgi:hypothetical protein
LSRREVLASGLKPPERTLEQAAVLRVWIGGAALYQAGVFGKRGVSFRFAAKARRFPWRTRRLNADFGTTVI